MRWLQDDGSSKDKVVCEENEESTLRAFFEIINHSSTRGAKFIHYNGMGFDIPFLTTRAAHYNIAITNRKFTNLRRFTFDNHIDVMLYLCNWNSYNSVSMDIACRSFGIPSPKEGDVKGDTVAKAFEDGNIEAVNEYVMRDVEATHQLFEKLKQYIF
jgi:DNA polymerase elongation subunit (family B)